MLMPGLVKKKIARKIKGSKETLTFSRFIWSVLNNWDRLPRCLPSLRTFIVTGVFHKAMRINYGSY